MEKISNYISVESQRLMHDTYDTYFIDVVTVLPNGKTSRGNLRSVSDIHLARQIARDYANANNTHVHDETLVVA